MKGTQVHRLPEDGTLSLKHVEGNIMNCILRFEFYCILLS